MKLTSPTVFYEETVPLRQRFYGVAYLIVSAGLLAVGLYLHTRFSGVEDVEELARLAATYCFLSAVASVILAVLDYATLSVQIEINSADLQFRFRMLPALRIPLKEISDVHIPQRGGNPRGGWFALSRSLETLSNPVSVVIRPRLKVSKRNGRTIEFSTANPERVRQMLLDAAQRAFREDTLRRLGRT